MIARLENLIGPIRNIDWTQRMPAFMVCLVLESDSQASKTEGRNPLTVTGTYNKFVRYRAVLSEFAGTVAVESLAS